MKRLSILASASFLFLATLAVAQGEEQSNRSQGTAIEISATPDLAYDVAALGPCIAIHALRVEAVEAFAYVAPAQLSPEYSESVAAMPASMPLYFRGGESFAFMRLSRRDFHGNYFPVGSKLSFRPRNQSGTTGHYRNC